MIYVSLFVILLLTPTVSQSFPRDKVSKVSKVCSMCSKYQEIVSLTKFSPGAQKMHLSKKPGKDRLKKFFWLLIDTIDLPITPSMIDRIDGRC